MLLVATEPWNQQKARQLKEQIKTSGISTTDLDQITDTGFDKYVFLYELEQILKDNNFIEQFNVSDNVDENKEQSGYLRNIFINIGHLQSIFKEGGLTTLGETMNVLFKSLSANTLNEINLTNSANLDIPGVYYATERTPTDDPEYGVRYNRDVSDGFLYEFQCVLQCLCKHSQTFHKNLVKVIQDCAKVDVNCK